MSEIHAGPYKPWNRPPSECRWSHHHEDVTLWCSARAIPGGFECADHLIQRCQAPGFKPRLPERRPRSFPSVAVPSDVPPAFSKEPQP